MREVQTHQQQQPKSNTELAETFLDLSLVNQLRDDKPMDIVSKSVNEAAVLLLVHDLRPELSTLGLLNPDAQNYLHAIRRDARRDAAEISRPFVDIRKLPRLAGIQRTVMMYATSVMD